MIRQAESNQQSSSTARQQQQQQQQQQPGTEPASASAGTAATTTTAAETGSGGDQQPPGREEADLQSVFEESSVEWGALPRRFRDMIRQGLHESMSRSYRRMTEDYYRKIAEEA